MRITFICSAAHVARTRGATICERVWKGCKNLISCLGPSSLKKTCNCQHWKWPRGWGVGDTREASDVHPPRKHLTLPELLNHPCALSRKISQTKKSLNCWPDYISVFKLTWICNLFSLAQKSRLRKQTRTSWSLKACSVTPVSACAWGCKYDQLCACKK